MAKVFPHRYAQLCSYRGQSPYGRILHGSTRTLEMIQPDERYYKRYKSSHSHDVLLKFKSLRNMIVSKIRTAKKEFFENLASSISDTKKFWSTIRSIQPRVDFSSCSLTNGSTTVSDHSDKATMLNNFFASCFNQTFVPIFYQIPSPSACRSELDGFDCVPEEVCIHLKNIKITIQLVLMVSLRGCCKRLLGSCTLCCLIIQSIY